jgi:hypothetical protein
MQRFLVSPLEAGTSPTGIPVGGSGSLAKVFEVVFDYPVAFASKMKADRSKAMRATNVNRPSLQ